MTMLNVFMNNIFRSRDYLYINIIVFFISLMVSTLYLEQSNDYTSMFILFPMNVAHLNMVGAPWHRSEHFSPLKSRSYIWSTEDRIIILHQVKLSFKSASLSTEDSFFFFLSQESIKCCSMHLEAMAARRLELYSHCWIDAINSPYITLQVTYYRGQSCKSSEDPLATKSKVKTGYREQTAKLFPWELSMYSMLVGCEFPQQPQAQYQSITLLNYAIYLWFHKPS